MTEQGTRSTLVGQSGTRYRLWVAGCGWRFFRVEGDGELYAQREGEQELRRVTSADIEVEMNEAVEVRRLTFYAPEKIGIGQ